MSIQWKKSLFLLGIFGNGLGCDNAALALLLELDAEITTTCTDPVINQNFIGAFIPTSTTPGTSEWTSETSTTVSDGQVFAYLIPSTGKREGVLVLGGRSYLGYETGQTWEFSHEGFNLSSTTHTHFSGYAYTADVEDRSLTTITLNLGTSPQVGQITVEDQSDGFWAQSDQWSMEADAAGAIYDNIPTSSYGLVRINELDQEEIATNLSTRADCSGFECQLEVSSRCTSVQNLTIYQTEWPEDANFGAVSGAGQPYGN